MRSNREILNLKTLRKWELVQEIVLRKVLKLEKMTLESSEGCQRCVVGDRLVELAAAGRDSRQTGQTRPPSASVLVGATLVLPRYSGWTGWTARWPMSTYSCGRLPCCAWSVCGFGYQIQSQSESGSSSDGPESLLPRQGR